MKNRTLFVVSFFIFVQFVACTSSTDPTPTPVVQVEEAITLQVAPTKLEPTKTSLPTPVSPSSIPSSTTTLTPIPTPTLTPTTIATQTITPAPDLVVEVEWSDIANPIAEFRSSNLIWSPAKNEFASISYPNEPTAIYLAKSPLFELVDITPTELSSYVVVLWHPTGDYFFFNAIGLSEGYEWYSPHEWKVVSEELEVTELGRSSYPWGWLNDHLIVYENRVGTGVNQIGVSNVTTEEGVAGTTFSGSTVAVSEDYVILYSDSYLSVAVLAQESISPEFSGAEYGTYVKFLSWHINENTSHIERTFNSAFADVLPGTNEILALTWVEETYLDATTIFSGSISLDLQLWNVNTDEVAMIIPGGIYGRFSPDGGSLLFMTIVQDSPQIELMNYSTRETIFRLPVHPELGFTTFSPNGRYVTFFSPVQFTLNNRGQIETSQITDQTFLTMFDIEAGQFLPQILANPGPVMWSPMSDRLTYQTNQSEMFMFDVGDTESYRIVQVAGGHLANPQWSYDGTYLSLDVYPCSRYCFGQTAVLEMP